MNWDKQARPRRILLVDDEPDFLQLISAQLKKAGFTVDAFPNGAEGVASAAQNTPDIVLLDMLMPESDGLDTYHKLREAPNTKSTPIIFLTAMAVEGHWEPLDYDADGPSFVMGKPYDPALIVQRIQEVLRKKSV